MAGNGLQWGRGLSAADMAVSDPARAALAPSMGPRLFSRGHSGPRKARNSKHFQRVQRAQLSHASSPPVRTPSRPPVCQGNPAARAPPAPPVITFALANGDSGYRGCPEIACASKDINPNHRLSSIRAKRPRPQCLPAPKATGPETGSQKRSQTCQAGRCLRYCGR